MKERTIIKPISWFHIISPIVTRKRPGTRRDLSVTTSAILSICFGLFLIFPFEVLGENNSTSSSSLCVCGVDRVPCAKNLTSLDCPNGRVIARRDCTCCFVCAKQLTDACDNIDAPCDSDYGLECGTDKRCKAKTQCSDDTSCSNDLMCVGGACADPCKVLPDVCQEANMTNGICVARNHRAMCSCGPGTALNAMKECAPISEDEEVKKCEIEGRQLNPGDNIFQDKCLKTCKCAATGELSCEKVTPTTLPQCKSGFIPMSNITGEMTDACKILVGNDSLFDGCCVPEKCQIVKSQDNTNEESSKGGRDFKLTESHNNLGEDDKMRLKLEATKDLDGNAPGGASDSTGTLTPSRIEDKLMQVIVLKQTDHSAVINLPKNDKEAILSISLTKELIDSPGNAALWKEHKIPAGLPQITLSDLLANTSYTLKYSADSKEYPTVQFVTKGSSKIDENLSLGGSSEIMDSSEIIEPSEPTGTSGSGENFSEEAVSTAHPESSVGCLYNGTSYETGDNFFVGCDERCECMHNGEVKCMERCSIPLFKKGAFAHDKMCFEEPSGVDDCCVIIACARATPSIGTDSKEIIAIMPQPCDSVKCGNKAHCLGPAGMLSDEEQQTNQTLCVCDDGFIGDPYDEVHGCMQSKNATPTTSSDTTFSSTVSSIPASSTMKSEGCVSKNKTYEYGEEQLDDCSYKCTCEHSGEFLCVPRCNYRRDEEKEIPAGCEVQKDPSDLECCYMLVCHGEPLESGTKKGSPTVPIDGCVYKNKTYKPDEKFYDGCDHQCMCFSNGDVTCQPRCPPAASNSSGDDCVTLPDPTDKCCSVTVCGNTTLSDVMKAANEKASTMIIEDTTTTVVPALGIGRSSLQKSLAILEITLIQPLNDTAIQVSAKISDVDISSLLDQIIYVQYSSDMKKWDEVQMKVREARKSETDEIQITIPKLSPSKEYYFKVKLGDVISHTASGFTKKSVSNNSMEASDSTETSGGDSIEADINSDEDSAMVSSAEKIQCVFKDKKYEYGQEFFDECDSYCSCKAGGKVRCEKIECPEDGLELLDQSCVRWEAKGRKEAPNCCPEMFCAQNSSCTMDNGLVISNYDEIPQKITGCDKRCYCEYGNITCQNLCPPMTETPPPGLPCPKEFAAAVTMPENECCYQWICRHPQLPPGISINNTNGLKNKLDPAMLNKSPSTTVDRTNASSSNTRKPFLNGTQTHAQTPPHFPHSHEHDEEHDQFVPPSTGNQPTLVSLDKISPHQLQELLHHLTGEPGHVTGAGNAHDAIAHDETGGTYLQVQTAQQAQELEKELGAKFVEQAEDGSYILVIPNTQHYDDQTFSDHLGQGPPYSPGHPSGFPGGHPFPFQIQRPHPGMQDRSRVSNVVIHPLNESTLQIDFTVSPILVGLQGHVEVVYTSEFDHKPNPAQWDRKVFQQAEDLIDNVHLQLFLTSLQPDTTYHVQIKVVLVQSDVHPTSDVLTIRTPPIPIPSTTLPPEILTDPEIKLVDSPSSNSVKLQWRKFTEMEKNLIDGVQVTYKANDDKVYSTTPMIHRALGEYQLENLQADKDYEINLLFIPFDTNQATILKSEKPIFVHTPPTEDNYAFGISVSSGKITQSSVELNIEGVPEPEDKFVYIYKVIFTSGQQKEQKSYFKQPKRETNKKATLTDLLPGTNYTLWVEAFLSNGKKKISNVISVQTKEGPLPRPEMSGQDHVLAAGTQKEIPQTTSYYGALVALAIVAALSIIGVIALLMILIKKQNYAKAPINDRKSESSYDNPSFKSYDVESNGHMKPSEL